MNKAVLLIFLISVLFAGCARENEVVPLPTESDTPMIESTSVPTFAQPIATNTELGSNPLQEPQTYCEITPGRQTGKIMFYAPNKGLYFYDTTNGASHIIPNTTDIFTPLIASSPDHHRIAYFDINNENGWIISSNEKIIDLDTSVVKKIGGIFYGWIDNKRVVFVEKSHSDGSSAILDVETGALQEITTNLTDVNFDAIHWYAGGSQPSIVLDSTLDRMAYLSDELPTTNLSQLGFIMRDRKTQDVLWAKETSDVNVRPKWSPDSAYAAFVVAKENEGKDKIYVVDREGQEKRTIDTNMVGVDSIEWSPDGTKISYTGTGLLGIYDLASNQLQEFQFPEEIGSMIWSPNGSHIAIPGFFVDVFHGCLIKQQTDPISTPLAWLVDVP